jgi:hypothetical protein
MKKLLYLTSLVLLFSCNPREEKQLKAEIKKESKYNRLLSKYKKISIDTLKVYSPEELKDEFNGFELDSADVILFPTDIAQQYFNDPPGLYAIYKFAIDDNRTGLITRTPSKYAPTSIKLFFFDKVKDTITSYIELAENLGDAGDYMRIDSWLFKENNKRLRALTRVIDGHYNSVENDKDTTKEEWNRYYLLDLSKANVDTINKDEKELIKKFGSLIKQKVSR